MRSIYVVGVSVQQGTFGFRLLAHTQNGIKSFDSGQEYREG